MSNFLKYLNQRSESSDKMKSLNLSEEFEEFKFEQEESHQNLMKKLDKVKMFGLFGAAALTIGGAAAIVSGAALPVLVGTVAAAYTSAGVSLSGKIKEWAEKRNHEKDYGTSDAFFKKMDEDAKNKGDDFYNDFVKEKSQNSRLSENLSKVSNSFKEIKLSQEKEENIMDLKNKAIKYRNA